MLETQLEQDLKAALLLGDSVKTDTLRGIKSALLYAKVEKGKKETGLSRDEELAVLAKESKKRSESAEAYRKGGSPEREQRELNEKAIIDKYLPEAISEEELSSIVQQTVNKLGASTMADMGKVIAAVKAKTAGSADGGMIAQIVKEQLSQ